ncbi:hypothetical protein L0337_15135 [candidate division KSB1 bacterium]|nr:hypothetical protein [candidate division KSB1 bacterium]
MTRKKKEPQNQTSSRYPMAADKVREKPHKISEVQAEYGIIVQTGKSDNPKILKTYSSRLAEQKRKLVAKSAKLSIASPRYIAGVEMPDTVWQFARKNALFPHLETALRLVHECFPEVKSIKLAYEFDWEIKNESWIAINIQVPGEVDNVLKQYLFFNRQIPQQILPDKSDKILLGIGGLGNP